QPAHREGRPLQAAILPIETPDTLRLAVRVGASVERAREPQMRRHLVGRLVDEPRLADVLSAVPGGSLGIADPAGLEVATLGEVLRQGAWQREREEGCRELHEERRMACSVKASSSSGRLYVSFSRRKIV